MAPARAAITFAVIGDYGMDNAAEGAVASLVAGWRPDFVVTTGDDYYAPAGGQGSTRYDESTGAYYCTFLKDAVTGGSRCGAGQADANRFFPVPGNHDWSDAGPWSWSTYTGYFTLPGAGIVSSGSSGNERYYDFVKGPVHFFMVNSNTNEPDGAALGSKQAHWLQRQLAASTSPWNVVVLHHPPFSSGARHGSSPWVQWPFATWGADLVLSGHEHNYERLARSEITYVVNGLGGGARYGFGEPVPGSLVRYDANWGAMRVTATAKAMHVEFRSVGGNDRQGVVQDRFDLVKTPPVCPAPPARDGRETP